MDKEKIIREKIREQVYELYKIKHASKPFISGESPVFYAGRVFDEKEIQALVDSSLDFWLTLGPRGDEFEQKMAKYIGVRFCSLVNSGSSANLLAFGSLTSVLLKDRRITPGSEVITVAAAFPTTVAPIIQHQCIPVFVDIAEDTNNIDVSKLEEALSDKTRAVMIAHSLGNPFDLDSVTDFCKRHNLFLIEDNCDALGSEYKGKRTGSFGHVSTVSFYPAHHMTMGEGGAVFTDDAVIKKAINSLRDWGRDCWCAPGKENTCGKRFSAQYGELPEGYDHKYVYSHFGYNLKPLDLQAAIGCVQLDKLPSFVEARKNNFKTFYEALKQYEEYFILPQATNGSDPSWFGFPLTVREGSGVTRAEIVSHLEKNKIQTRMLFAGNIIRQPLFYEMRQRGEGYRVVGGLVKTDRIVNNMFWIGVYPGLTNDQIEFIIKVFGEFFSERKISV